MCVSIFCLYIVRARAFVYRVMQFDSAIRSLGALSGRYELLSDILGLEDFLGDMDFKARTGGRRASDFLVIDLDAGCRHKLRGDGCPTRH